MQNYTKQTITNAAVIHTEKLLII